MQHGRPAERARSVSRRCRDTSTGLAILAVALALALTAAAPAGAQQSESRPYDDKLLRLAEILGAVHYLRELCGANDGQLWRERMREILEGEGASAARKAKLAKSFNAGYRGYSRTHQSCSPTAQTAINRFLAEGAQLADGLVKAVP